MPLTLVFSRMGLFPNMVDVNFNHIGKANPNSQIDIFSLEEEDEHPTVAQVPNDLKIDDTITDQTDPAARRAKLKTQKLKPGRNYPSEIQSG